MRTCPQRISSTSLFFYFPICFYSIATLKDRHIWNTSANFSSHQPLVKNSCWRGLNGALYRIYNSANRTWPFACVIVAFSKQIPPVTLWGVAQHHNIRPYMATLVLQHTGGLSRRPGVTPLLSAFTSSLKCRTAWGMFCTNVQINTDRVICVWYRLSSSSGPLRFPACLLHGSLSSPAVSDQRCHYATRQTVTLGCLCASSVSMDDTQRCHIKSQLWSCISHESCSISIQDVEPRTPIHSQAQTPQTPDDPVIVYSGTQTQLWSSHLPPLLLPTFDPQGLADSRCVMSVCVCVCLCVSGKNSWNSFYWKKISIF